MGWLAEYATSTAPPPTYLHSDHCPFSFVQSGGDPAGVPGPGCGPGSGPDAGCVGTGAIGMNGVGPVGVEVGGAGGEIGGIGADGTG